MLVLINDTRLLVTHNLIKDAAFRIQKKNDIKCCYLARALYIKK